MGCFVQLIGCVYICNKMWKRTTNKAFEDRLGSHYDAFQQEVASEWICINPFTVPACEGYGLNNDRNAPANSLFSGPLTPAFNAIRLNESHFTCPSEKEDKKAWGFQISNLFGRFQATSWRWRGYRETEACLRLNKEEEEEEEEEEEDCPFIMRSSTTWELPWYMSTWIQ